MRSWWLWCQAQTSLCWWAAGEHWGRNDGRPGHHGDLGPVIRRQGLGECLLLLLLLTPGSSTDKAKLTGTKILSCSLLGTFLKRPLDGFRNLRRWIPPFSSPRSKSEGWSGLWQGYRCVIVIKMNSKQENNNIKSIVALPEHHASSKWQLGHCGTLTSIITHFWSWSVINIVVIRPF